MSYEVLLRITAPHFVAGYACDRKGKCFAAAPILRWCIGKQGHVIADYCARKRWSIEVVHVAT